MTTFDFPGHGDSDNSPIPETTYTLPGFADATVQLIAALKLKHPVIVGWSMGGHIAIELMARLPRLRGVFLIGSPPVGKVNGVNDRTLGFKGSPAGSLAGKEEWSNEEATVFVHRIFLGSEDHELIETAKRADGRFRTRMFHGSLEGLGVNQREVVEASTLSIAIVNGELDTGLNLEYFDSLHYKNLWNGKVVRQPGVGHAPFWQAPQEFNASLRSFLSDLDR